MKIVIVDYGMGNIHSVFKKLRRVCSDVVVSSNPFDVESADKIILPGVGHFQVAIQNLKALNLFDCINEQVLVRKKPILGICLGMQLMAANSEEGSANGFGWINAEVIRFRIQDKMKFKIPHMGWNCVIMLKESRLMKGIPDASEYYFAHSYHLKTEFKSEMISETIYEEKFPSALEKDNIFGVQFHPEKSHDPGEQMLKNFIEI